MNEKDLMNTLEHQTKDIPIPDSISPLNMKKMLDAHIEETESAQQLQTSLSPSENAMKRHRIRRYATVACVTLCLLGSIGAGTFIIQNKKNATDTTGNQAFYEEACEEVAESATETQDSDIAFQTDLESPESYDAYYDTLKSAYDKYYDSITNATVTEKQAATNREIVTDSMVKEFSATDIEENSMEIADATKESMADKSDRFSTTNTQETGIDEGDIVKTDGTYIYRITKELDETTYETVYKLHIIATKNGELNRISTLDLDEIMGNSKDSEYRQFSFDEFYLQEDKLILLYHTNNIYGYTDTPKELVTCISIIDITDRSNPKKEKTFTQSGYLVSSRISNGYLYTVSNFEETSLTTKQPYSNYIPSVNGNTIACKDIYYPRDIFMERTFVITSLNLKNPKKLTDQKAIPAFGSNVYVSDTSIYIYGTKYDTVTKTEITKVGYEKGKLNPGMSATITGYLYNSFALSEYDGYLRIIATIPANNISLLRKEVNDDMISKEAAPNTMDILEDVNALYILDENMELTGKIAGIAPGETIYSARFMGEIGYFVTYRNTDPLFCVDLSDPYNPEIIGELKIPGFSNYLHQYTDNLLLGFGEATDPVTQEFKGLKLSMFNISNKTDITEQDQYILENSWYSEAQYNHKAMMIDPQKNIFGFAYAQELDHNGKYEQTYYYVTYQYTPSDGFVETGRYRIDDKSRYNMDAIRGVFINDYLYISTDDSITSYKIGTNSKIETIHFQ